jgi:hypothetical protein
MALVVVTNVSNHLVTLRLNSGETLILDPKVSSENRHGDSFISKIARPGCRWSRWLADME